MAASPPSSMSEDSDQVIAPPSSPPIMQRKATDEPNANTVSSPLPAMSFAPHSSMSSLTWTIPETSEGDAPSSSTLKRETPVRSTVEVPRTSDDGARSEATEAGSGETHDDGMYHEDVEKTMYTSSARAEVAASLDPTSKQKDYITTSEGSTKSTSSLEL